MVKYPRFHGSYVSGGLSKLSYQSNIDILFESIFAQNVRFFWVQLGRSILVKESGFCCILMIRWSLQLPSMAWNIR